MPLVVFENCYRFCGGSVFLNRLCLCLALGRVCDVIMPSSFPASILGRSCLLCLGFCLEDALFRFGISLVLFFAFAYCIETFFLFRDRLAEV